MHRTLALVLGMGAAAAAFADSAETKGGIKITSDDGAFEGSLGGTINYDYETFQKDVIQTGYSEGPFLRRAILSLSGKVYGFKYRLQSDLKGSSPEAKDMWIGTDALWGFVKVGHMQPAYGMEELTNRADLLMTERPYISNDTIYSGREFQNGISYNTDAHGLTALVVGYSANVAADKNAAAPQATSANGNGESARVTYSPLIADGAVVHLGASYDNVEWKTGPGANAPAVFASEVARNGPAVLLVPATAYDRQGTAAGELAGEAGPVFAQAEYARAKYGFVAGSDETVTSYYVQASVFATGESKPYRPEKGVFGNPVPRNSFGAIEAKARYAFVQNADAPTAPRATMTTVGINYYFNANARAMLDYNFGDAETLATRDKPRALVLRGQLVF